MSTHGRYRDRVSELDADEMALWHAWKSAADTVRARIAEDITAAVGLSDADFAVLTRVAELGGGRLRQNALAESVGWHRSRLSHQLSRMEQRDLLTRHPADGGVEVHLTDAGHSPRPPSPPRPRRRRPRSPAQPPRPHPAPPTPPRPGRPHRHPLNRAPAQPGRVPTKSVFAGQTVIPSKHASHGPCGVARRRWRSMSCRGKLSRMAMTVTKLIVRTVASHQCP
ncbi:MarR family winged helix-turn-helix transcriptional regulator [Kutzneria sp. 744]|uniref:MarR family winged helix-turn-helix transcriptional regulator n=1 Tax=Kutzneria sp. (strain 744) TaxID=345341 RepID=UPI0003EEBADE|nr:transcriptional regulator [Kutzneria sp. 744]